MLFLLVLPFCVIKSSILFVILLPMLEQVPPINRNHLPIEILVRGGEQHSTCHVPVVTRSSCWQLCELLLLQFTLLVVLTVSCGLEKELINTETLQQFDCWNLTISLGKIPGAIALILTLKPAFAISEANSLVR